MVYSACTDVLGYVLEVSPPYGVQVFKIGVSQKQRGGVELLAQKSLQPLQIEALDLSHLWAAVTDYLLWSLAPHLPALQSSYYTMFWHRHFIFPEP